VLAAINEVESNFGQNLATSSAGAVGWMQFEPDTWTLYGVTPTGAKAPGGPQGWDNPADAIFSAANYLHASGAPEDWQGAIFT
jgi:membrane-bound lytic murein transglycosylase B